jgi:hypothetical protein
MQASDAVGPCFGVVVGVGDDGNSSDNYFSKVNRCHVLNSELTL